MKHADGPIIVEKTFETSINAVWSALTDLDEMKQWFFENIPAFAPAVGFETAFAVHSGDRIFTHLWKVTEVILHQKITYNWKYLEYPGDSFVTFEFTEEGNQVKRKLTLDVVEDFRDDVPEFTRESCVEGWEYFLGKDLRKLLKVK
ncbi:SRPBCC domain-containing protein [bacterium]|nr:SRPBCC domain-containing protein [bacterium]